MSNFTIKKDSADVLVVGGGVAGLFAAIKAREAGASVLVVEKSNTLRSGNAGSGLDHIQSYVPEIHEKVGYSVDDMVEEQLSFGSTDGGLRRRDLIDYFVRNMYDRVLELERYGLNFRYADSGLPGNFRIGPQWHNVPTSLNFEGRDIKPVLTKKALSVGVKILNRAYVRELVKDGEAVTGALARTHDLPLDTPQYKERYREIVDGYHAQRAQILPRLKAGERLYFDLSEATDAELDYILWTLGHEGKTGVLLRHWKKHKTDLRKAKFPLKVGGRAPSIKSGVWIKDFTAETNVPNLYAAGNELAATGMGGVTNAVVFGVEAGLQAAARAQTLAPVVVPDHRAEALRGELDRILDRKDGDRWLDAERALQDLIDQNLGRPYTALGLDHTWSQYRRLRAALNLGAANLHELTRALEVVDLYDLAELVLTAVTERKSSLAGFRRADEKDWSPEAFGDSVAVFKVNGQIQTRRLSNLKTPAPV